MLIIKLLKGDSQTSSNEQFMVLGISPKEQVDVKAIVSCILNKIGISPCNVGYHFLREGIIMTIKDEWAIFGITKGMYPNIAKTYETSSSRVESAMRHAISSAWKRGGSHIYCKITESEDSKRPANGQFIACIAEYVRLNIDINPIKTA